MSSKGIDYRAIACDIALEGREDWDIPPVVLEYLQTRAEKLRPRVREACTEAARIARAKGEAADRVWPVQADWAALAALEDPKRALWAVARAVAGYRAYRLDDQEGYEARFEAELAKLRARVTRSTSSSG